jgi:hypothetical protein
MFVLMANNNVTTNTSSPWLLVLGTSADEKELMKLIEKSA